MIAALLFLTAGRSFYLSPTGDDALDGRSPNHAWRTLGHASKQTFAAGDAIVLSGGATYEGSLEITTGGTPQRPLILRSEGKPATIHCADAGALVIRTGGVEVRDLVLTGGGKELKGNEGIHIYAPTGRHASHVRIDRVDVSGFGAQGIIVSGETKTGALLDDVRISHTTVHGCYGTGIESYDSTGEGVYALHDLRVTDCLVANNFEGNGLIFGGVDGATIEYVHSAHNHGDKGGLGMWAWSAKHVAFRYCIANGVRSKSDGGGYDLDGGTVDCAVEHCLSYDNIGPGYMHCDYPKAPRTEGNVMRDDVSIDDGSPGGSLGVGYVVWGSGLYNCRIERNLIVVTKPDPKMTLGGALFADFIHSDADPAGTQRLEGAVFRDNVVEILGKGVAFVRNDFPPTEKCDLKFEGNSYRSKDAAPFIVGPEKATHTYANLADWQAAGNDKGPGSLLKGASAIGDYAQLEPRDLPAFFKRLGR